MDSQEVLNDCMIAARVKLIFEYSTCSALIIVVGLNQDISTEMIFTEKVSCGDPGNTNNIVN